MPGFKTRSQSELESIKTRLNAGHSEAEIEAFAKIKGSCASYLEAVRQGLGLEITVEDFAKVAKEKTSAELKAWALENGIEADTITTVAGNLLGFLADANRYGFKWDDLFNE